MNLTSRSTVNIECALSPRAIAFDDKVMNQFYALDLKKELTRLRTKATIALCADIERTDGTRVMSARQLDSVVGTGAESRVLRTCFKRVGGPNKRHRLGLIWAVDKEAVQKLHSYLGEYEKLLLKAKERAWQQALEQVR
jgi:hypothetical protein